MNRLQLTHDRVVAAQRRRAESAARRKAAEQKKSLAAQQREELERLEALLTQLGGFRLTRTSSELCVEHVVDMFLARAVDMFLVWVVGVVGTVVGALLWTGVADLGEPAFARALGGYLFLAGGAALGIIIFKRRTRTVVRVTGDGHAFDALHLPVSRELTREKRRQMLMRELRALEGAQVTVLPSLWDRVVQMARVRLGKRGV